MSVQERAQVSSINGFERFPFASGDIHHGVYHRGSGPPIIVLHELPGLAQPAVNLANRLATDGFTVFLPHLFGSLLRYAPGANYFALCISKEFACLRAGVEAPITQWLRDLADSICMRENATRIGAIGMCVTGAFAIPLVLAHGVRAAVASQPAIHISWRHWLFKLDPGSAGPALNISDAQLAGAAVRSRADAVPLFALRFQRDRVCVHAKMERIQQAFGTSVHCDELPDSGPSSTRGPHAVLTEEYDKGTPQAVDAYKRVVSFLRENLA